MDRSLTQGHTREHSPDGFSLRPQSPRATPMATRTATVTGITHPNTFLLTIDTCLRLILSASHRQRERPIERYFTESLANYLQIHQRPFTAPGIIALHRLNSQPVGRAHSFSSVGLRTTPEATRASMKGPTTTWLPSSPKRTAFSGDGYQCEKTQRVPRLVLEIFTRFCGRA